MMAFRNPFEHWSGNPKPKPFQMGNQGQSDNSIFLGGRETYEMKSPVQSTAAPPEKRQPASEWSSYLQEMDDIYNKEGEAASAYREHMGAVPQYQTPTKWGKFGAALVGGMEGLRSGAGAGFQAGQDVAAAPYKRAMEQWGVKEQALGRSAEMEDKASNRRLSYIKEKRAISSERDDMSKWMAEFELKQDKEDNDEAQRQAERDHWKDQGWKTRIDQDGNEIAYNPAVPGSDRVLGKSSKVRDWGFEAGRLGASQEGNRISAANAGTNRDRLGLARETEGRMVRREGRYENPPISASEQSSARTSALGRAATERRDWTEFVSPEGTVTPPQDPAKRAKFREFMRRVESIEDGIFGRKRDLGPGEEPPLDY